MSNSNKPCTETGHQPNTQQLGQAAFGHLAKLDRGFRIMTPQGTLVIKLESEVPAPVIVNSGSNADISASSNANSAANNAEENTE